MRKFLVLGLSLLGLWDSAYLWWVYTSPSRPMVCLGTGCDVVRVSSYAHLWGLPLPVYGVALYALLTLLILAESVVGFGRVSRIRNAIATVSGAGFLVSLGLTRIEAFVLHAWCAWCVVSALAVTIIFGLALTDVIRPSPREPAAGTRTLRGYLVLIVIAFGVGTPALILLVRHGELPPPDPVSATALAERLAQPDSHLSANPQAGLTVVEFGDFECLMCGQVQPVVKKIKQKYGNQIRFVFRQFPQVGIHPYAERAAEASECAAEQGKFWEAVEKLYDQQNDLSEPALDGYAAELGLDSSRFRQCLSSGSMAARVQRDVDDAHALHLRGTPTFFVGRQRIEGLIEYERFARLVDQELASGSATSPQTTADPKATTSPLSNNPANAFTQFQSSALACSEEEAKKHQPTLIRTPEAQEYFKSRSKTLFVDVSPSKDFASGRIPGAINVPVDDIGRRWNFLLNDRTIVFYESGRSAGDVCASGRAAARVLLVHGFPPERVKVYQDGLAAWEKAGLPVQR